MIFQFLETNEKKNLIIMKKMFVQKIEFWATAQVYCKAKKIVLQPEEKRKNRIARLVLYCNRGRL